MRGISISNISMLRAIGIILAITFIAGSAKGMGEEIHLCRPNNMVSAALYIAQERGFFPPELQFRISSPTNAKICLDMLTAGQADLMVGAEGPFVYAARHNPPVKIIAFGGSNPETALVARRSAGIESVPELRGKKIGYLPGTISFFFMYHVLKHHGVWLREVSLVPLQPPMMPHALAGKHIDAFFMWEPWATQGGTALGADAVVLRFPELYSYQILYLAREEFLVGRNNIREQFLSAVSKANSFMKSNREESIQLLSKNLALPAPILESLWEVYRYEIGSGDSGIEIMERGFEALRETDPSFSGLSVPEFRKFLHGDLRSLHGATS